MHKVGLSIVPLYYCMHASLGFLNGTLLKVREVRVAPFVEYIALSHHVTPYESNKCVHIYYRSYNNNNIIIQIDCFTNCWNTLYFEDN